MRLGFAIAALFAGRNRQPADHGQRQYGSEKDSHTRLVRNRWRKSHGIVGLFLVLSLASCGVKQRPLLEDLHHREDFGLMRLASARGLRDGDRLAAQLLITDSSTMLTMDLHFLVTPPTRLDTSAWKSSQGGSGTVEARSITFLGGQSEPPSLGGTFDLIDSQGQALYRVHLPTTPLQK